MFTFVCPSSLEFKYSWRICTKTFLRITTNEFYPKMTELAERKEKQMNLKNNCEFIGRLIDKNVQKKYTQAFSRRYYVTILHLDAILVFFFSIEGIIRNLCKLWLLLLVSKTSKTFGTRELKKKLSTIFNSNDFKIHCTLNLGMWHMKNLKGTLPRGLHNEGDSGFLCPVLRENKTTYSCFVPSCLPWVLQCNTNL